ncbi:MAG: AAA family ATPase [Carnobacterium sp.]|uniref:P-loop NTPase fold protein n=1 Tax=Carnobacterium sp. TaxID=48221 RepID=UPI002FCA7D89
MNSTLKINWAISKGEYEAKNVNNDYLFYDQIKTIENLLEENNKENFDDSNKVISVCGERGSGKSSFIRTLSKQLTKSNKYFVLDKIDPTAFDSRLSILELFISEIYQQTNKNQNDDSLIEIQHKINLEIKTIMGILKTIRKDKSGFSDSHPSIEVLLSINAQTNLDKNLKSLIRSFEKLISSNLETPLKIVMVIDDLDLINNKKAYQVLEDINKYLATNISIVIAYREQQLLSTVIETRVKENEILLNKKLTSETEIIEQAVKYIEKLLPKSQRTYLNITDIVGLTVYDILKNFMDIEENNETATKDLLNFTIKDFIIKKVYETTKINIEPVDRKELTNLIYPTTLRSSLQYLEVIFSLKNINQLETNIDPETTNAKSKIETLLKNIFRYKSFLLNKSDEDLPTSYSSIIKNWLGTIIDSKNHYAASSVLKKIDNSELPDHLQLIPTKQNYNVALGDVFAVFEEFKSQSSGELKNLHFIYMFKLFYSITLLQEYLNILEKSFSDEQILNLNSQNTNYELLLNGKIMPNKFYYAQDIISNDEKCTIKVDKNNYKDLYDSSMIKENSLIDKLIVSDITAKGDINKHGQASISDFYSKNNAFQYRYFYNNKKLNLKHNSNYTIDPFTFLSKRSYINRTIKNYHNILMPSNEFKAEEMYVFYSLFDIDIFIRQNYSRQSQPKDEVFSYVLDRVNDIFTHVPDTSNLTLPIFVKINYPKSIGSKYNKIYDDEDKKLANKLLNSNTIKNKKTNKDIPAVYSLKKPNFINLLNNIIQWPNINQEDITSIKSVLKQLTSKPTNQTTHKLSQQVQDVLDKNKIGFTQTGEIIENE